jgi:hypothetical protein
VAAQLLASRVVLSSTELVSYIYIYVHVIHAHISELHLTRRLFLGDVGQVGV